MAFRLWRIGVLLVAAALLAAGCGGATIAPTIVPTIAPTIPPTIMPTTVPSPTPLPLPTATAGPTIDRIDARDAALAYVRARYGADAPAQDLDWTEQYATPADMVGTEVYQYMAGDWLIMVSYPVVLPEMTVYTVRMVNLATGFDWEGRADAIGQVIEGDQLLLNAFELALSHARAQDASAAPPAGLAWVAERITPPDTVGAETWRYTAGDWVATISYPVVPADKVVFSITIQNATTGFMWQGLVGANGQVTEVG